MITHRTFRKEINNDVTPILAEIEYLRYSNSEIHHDEFEFGIEIVSISIVIGAHSYPIHEVISRANILAACLDDWNKWSRIK